MQAIAEAGQRAVSMQCDQLLSLTRQHVGPVVRPGHPAATTSTLMRQVTHGDVVIVTRLDRLARSTRDLLNILEGFTREGVGFRSLRETSIDTTTPQGRLVISVLASIGEFERELIQARMTEGRQRARASGVKFGPKFKLNHFQRQEALARLQAGETQADVARTYNVDRATISRLQKVA